ncbi:MAG TPA: recombinase family protein [Bryobacteraceae bacterium]
MNKAFAYLRVSGKSQIEGDGFERQERAICAYAKAHGVKIVEVFKELGVSGTKDIANRPAFVAMMGALHSDGVKLVLVESLGRLARDLMVQESILHDLKRHHFELISVAEPDLCSDDPSRKLMRQVMGAFHEYEKAMIVIKLRGARQRIKLKRGSCEGRKPFGAHSSEQAIIDRARALRATGAGWDAIAATFNTEGVPTRTAGRRWFGSTVAKIMRRLEVAQ